MEPRTGLAWPRSSPPCKLNGIEPFAYMKATIEALVAGHRNVEIDQLLPWNFRALQSLLQMMYPDAPLKPRRRQSEILCHPDAAYDYAGQDPS